MCQVSSLKILGITFQTDRRFSEHVELKLAEANKCLFVIRCLRQEGYSHIENDYVFKSVALGKISFGLIVYGASLPELTTI